MMIESKKNPKITLIKLHHRALRNSGTARRSESNPYGMECYQSVLDGNRLAARTLCILWICAALGVWWFLEQPQNSWMQELPCFQDFMACVSCYRHRFCMRDYGGKSEKPTWLYSSSLLYSNKNCLHLLASLRAIEYIT